MLSRVFSFAGLAHSPASPERETLIVSLAQNEAAPQDQADEEEESSSNVDGDIEISDVGAEYGSSRRLDSEVDDDSDMTIRGDAEIPDEQAPALSPTSKAQDEGHQGLLEPGITDQDDEEMVMDDSAEMPDQQAPNSTSPAQNNHITTNSTVPGRPRPKERTRVRKYCTCRRDPGGDWVGCDIPDCRIEWYHLACVGLVVAPVGPWTCPRCVEQQRSQLAVFQTPVTQHVIRRPRVSRRPSRVEISTTEEAIFHAVVQESLGLPVDSGRRTRAQRLGDRSTAIVEEVMPQVVQADNEDNGDGGVENDSQNDDLVQPGSYIGLGEDADMESDTESLSDLDSADFTFDFEPTSGLSTGPLDAVSHLSRTQSTQIRIPDPTTPQGRDTRLLNAPSTPIKPKPGWKGWQEVSETEEDAFKADVEAQWSPEISPLDPGRRALRSSEVGGVKSKLYNVSRAYEGRL